MAEQTRPALPNAHQSLPIKGQVNYSNDDNGNKRGGGRKKAKTRGPMQLLRVALLMIRRRSPAADPTKHPPVQVEAGATWKSLVGSMRPLHLTNREHEGPALPSLQVQTSSSPVAERFEDVFPPPSPATSCSDYTPSSRFASAQNLQELDRCEEDEEMDGEGGDDVMIDTKAEEFIARFYKQMGQQRLGSVRRLRMLAKTDA